MKCIGDFVFKGIEERKGGEFKNSRGELIKYDSCYVLKVDEVTPSGIFERKLKIPKDNNSLLEKLRQKKPYDGITVQCDVAFYGGQAKVIPVDLIQQNNK